MTAGMVNAQSRVPPVSAEIVKAAVVPQEVTLTLPATPTRLPTRTPTKVPTPTAASDPLTRIAANFKAFREVSAVETCLWVPFKNGSAAPKVDVGIRIRASRATAAKFDWKTCNSTKVDSVLTGKEDFMHPILKAAFPKIKSR